MNELLTTAEMRESDRLAIAGGVPGIDLMEAAGKAVADCVALNHPQGSRITVVAGSGNNGGDGFVAARLLADRGYAVRILLAGSVIHLKGDAANAAKRWQGPTEPALPERLAAADAIVDALFGAGLDRPVEGLARALIDAMNAVRCPVYAVDLPSGINGTTGAVMGAAVKAAETVTFFRCKPGHLLLPGRLHCGRIHLHDIGIPARVLGKLSPSTFHNSPELWLTQFPVPRLDGHKYSRGHAVVGSGGISSTGAARIAARAALRAGAGLVTIASPREALAVNAAANLAVMVRPVDEVGEFRRFLDDRRRNAVLLGPGGGVGARMREFVLAVLEADPASVLDADALTSFAGNLSVLATAIKQRKGPVVLTPHEGEFDRLFSGLSYISEAASKLERARRAAAETGAIVLLKGADTVVATPDGRASITNNAPAWLATAGAGDVLGGICTGLLAQGMVGFEAVSAAVWLHAEAGVEAGPGLIAEELPDRLPGVYRRLLRHHPSS
jgi:hydroxyethylthiazole kinase-like uncharacterized protein yjeF